MLSIYKALQGMQMLCFERTRMGSGQKQRRERTRRQQER